MAEYNLRHATTVNYCEPRLPKATSGRVSRQSDKLYPVEIVETEGREEEAEVDNLYEELAFQIKAALHSGTRKDVDVRIDMPFDRLLFDGGLKRSGDFIRRSHNHDIFGIRRYADLDQLLGKGWHMRALNTRLDFCYANLQTVHFYLHKRRPLLEFTEDGEEKAVRGRTTVVFHGWCQVPVERYC